MPALEPAIAPSQRLDAVVHRVTGALAAAGIDTARLDARLLVTEATGLGVAELIARPEQAVAAENLVRLEALVHRRCRREPVSRILGERDFYGRTFIVTPAVLDPRPDSETLIEEALAIAGDAGWRDRPSRILDVGTGSGALLISLLAELPLATGLGTDTSEDALQVAEVNADHLGVGERAAFAQHDALDGIDGTFDLVVCNPPYIATAEIAGLAPEVRDHDPHAALDGGADGLDVYRKMIPQLSRVVPCGWVLFEVGAGQAGGVERMLREVAGTRVRSVRIRRDLAGHERSVATEIQL
jgi:release factor glutamine methyltransferase